MSKAQNKQSQETKSNAASWLKSHKWVKRAVIIFVVTYIVSLFVPYISGYTKFPLYVIGCGKLPIEANGLDGPKYYLPNNMYYRTYYSPLTTDHYFCSEAEAQKAGYQSDIYNH